MRPVSISGTSDNGGEWDLLVCASGYESRASAFARGFKGNVKRRIAVGFKEFTDHPRRSQNDKWFKEHGFEQVAASGSSDTDMERLLLALVGDLSARSRIIIDISSMTRTWYGTALRVIRDLERGPDELCTRFA